MARGVPDDIDPAQVTGVRAGNALWPGLLAFTGVSFFVYLLIKLAGGAIAADAGTFAQIGVSAVLLIAGGWVLVRARYFFVIVEMGETERKIGGLSKAEQVALMERYGPEATG